MPDTKSIGIAYRDQAIEGGAITSTSVAATTLTSSGASNIGGTAATVVGFHGATGADQAAFVATQSINALSVSGVVGFTSSTSLSSAMEKINSILACLIEKGLMAAS